uniref:Anoctamin n=1 Tax=Macrostomum lignano TaxID=282301 RepID=A0A1I8JQX3_9PLAT
VTFLENWKTQKNASWRRTNWDRHGLEEDEEATEAGVISALCSSYERKSRHGESEPHFPNSLRIPRIITTINKTCIIIMVNGNRGNIHNRRHYLPGADRYSAISKSAASIATASTVASGSAAIVNLILIMSLGKVYEEAGLQTELSGRCTARRRSFEDQLILKVFIFQFVISTRQFFTSHSSRESSPVTRESTIKFFGLRNEECDNGGCLIELAQQLAVIMIGKQIIKQLPGGFPAVRNYSPGSTGFTKGPELEPAVRRPRPAGARQITQIPYEALFEEYLEMVLQFGSITIFVAAFPLRPFFALLNNWLEIPADASKLVCETRRPVSERAQDIGGLAFLIAFTSEFLPKDCTSTSSTLSCTATPTSPWPSPANSTAQPCRYKAFRGEDGHYTMFYWKLLAVRLAFVIVFESQKENQNFKAKG